MSHTESRSRSVVQSINFELLAVPEAVLSHIELRSRSAVQSILCVAPRCPRGSLVPYKGEEQITCPFHSLCCSSLSQRQSRPIRKRGADQLCSSFSVLLLAIPEAVSSHTKVRSISSAGLSLRRELCAGWSISTSSVGQCSSLLPSSPLFSSPHLLSSPPPSL